MNKFLAIALLMLPCAAYAVEDCKVVEFEDHFDVTCIGDAKPIPIPKQGLIRTPTQPEYTAPVSSQTTEQQTTAPKDNSPDAAQSAGGSQMPPTGGTYAKKVGRQGRPSSDDMKAAIEARRKLIEAHGQNNQPVAQ